MTACYCSCCSLMARMIFVSFLQAFIHLSIRHFRKKSPYLFSSVSHHFRSYLMQKAIILFYFSYRALNIFMAAAFWSFEAGLLGGGGSWRWGRHLASSSICFALLALISLRAYLTLTAYADCPLLFIPVSFFSSFLPSLGLVGSCSTLRYALAMLLASRSISSSSARLLRSYMLALFEFIYNK